MDVIWVMFIGFAIIILMNIFLLYLPMFIINSKINRAEKVINSLLPKVELIISEIIKNGKNIEDTVSKLEKLIKDVEPSIPEIRTIVCMVARGLGLNLPFCSNVTIALPSNFSTTCSSRKNENEEESEEENSCEESN